MPETTETISCPECDIPFDTRDELERHSRQQHAMIKKSATDEKMTPAPGFEEKVQSRTEEKGKGETSESIKHG
jgi:hypothetical protein